jgi:quercetin dioxygenase-like cupin family protein
MPTSKPAYSIADKQIIAESPEVRATLMTFDPGQEIPWHTHSNITDTSFCLKGDVEVSLRAPEEIVRLEPGQWKAVPTGRPHRVRCMGPGQCQVLLVQGVGRYDFMPA